MTDGSAGNRKGMQKANMPTVWASQFLLICPFLFFEGRIPNDSRKLDRICKRRMAG